MYFHPQLPEPGCKEEGALKVVTGDALDLPFPDNSFDTVLCFDVFESKPR